MCSVMCFSMENIADVYIVSEYVGWTTVNYWSFSNEYFQCLNTLVLLTGRASSL